MISKWFVNKEVWSPFVLKLTTPFGSHIPTDLMPSRPRRPHLRAAGERAPVWVHRLLRTLRDTPTEELRNVIESLLWLVVQ